MHYAPRLQQRYAWGLRLQAPLPTARILPKPTKDWLKARPIISFVRTRAAPLLTVFGALIFELTKITFPDVPGQLSVQDLVYQLWEALSSAGPTEYIQLVSQDLSGFFTSIPTERFHQALQVLLHRYDQVVGLRNVSHWSIYEVKSDHRRRMFKGKWRRQTKVPRLFREEDLQLLLDFVINSSHFEINGYLFRQERASQWYLRLLLLFAILSPQWKIISGTDHDFASVSNARLVCSGVNAMCTIASYYYATRRRRQLSFTGIFFALQFYWRHRMAPKYLDTCVTQHPGRSRRSYQIIRLRPKASGSAFHLLLVVIQVMAHCAWSATSSPAAGWL